MKMAIAKALKKTVLSSCPRSLLFTIKKIHYYRLINRVSESSEVDLKPIKYFIKPGDVVVDVGSNIGVYTKHLSSLTGTEGKVLSIEPIPETYKILASNIRKLGLQNILPMNCAISDRKGIAVMDIPLDADGNPNFYEAKLAIGESQGAKGKVVVQVETLDDILTAWPSRISFIKLDVEGNELACLKGAQKFLQNNRPALLIETASNPDEPGSKAHLLFRMLNSFGYEPFWFDGQALHQRLENEIKVNYFFLNKGHQKLMPQEIQ